MSSCVLIYILYYVYSSVRARTLRDKDTPRSQVPTATRCPESLLPPRCCCSLPRSAHASVQTLPDMVPNAVPEQRGGRARV